MFNNENNNNPRPLFENEFNNIGLKEEQNSFNNHFNSSIEKTKSLFKLITT